LEDNKIEYICLEINLQKQKWFTVATYNLPTASSDCFQNSLINIVDKASLSYEKFIIIGDLNNTLDNPYLTIICSTIGLSNLIKEPTCYKPNCNPSSIAAILTNHKAHFRHRKGIETSISDYHRMILTAWKSHPPKCHATLIYYREFIYFSEDLFLQHLKQASFQLCDSQNNAEDAFRLFGNIICSVVHTHAPLKKILVKANNKPLATEHRKAIRLLRKLKSTYNRNRTQSNFENYKNKEITVLI